MKSKIIRFLLLSTLLANGITSLHASRYPIKIITNDWTTQVVLSKITGELLVNRGYQVEYVNMPTSVQWYKIGNGTVHVQMEVWQGTMEEQYLYLMESHSILDLGNHPATTREDWWYPEYVEKFCPGLPDWRALKKCAHVFAKGNGEQRGLYLGGPWEKPDSDRIIALGLNFNLVRVSHGDELWVELENAYRKQQPIVLFNWTPNWVELTYKGKFIEFPEYDAQCEIDPSWGVNPYSTYDCGNPKQGWLKKIAWVGLKDEYPCAVQLIERIELTGSQFSMLSYWVDVEKLSYQQAADRWLKENEPLWRDWLKFSCKN